MTTLSTRVTTARDRLGWSQSELARRISQRRALAGKSEVKQQSINQLELGEVENPRYLVDLAEVLSVSANWLVGETDADSGRNDINRVPLISWVEAGELSDIADPYVPGDAEEWIPVNYRHNNLIALRVRGHSMDKVAPEGSIIVVDLSDRSPMDGKHYVFKHDGRATFKTYRAGPPIQLEPQSTDPEYAPLYPGDGCEIVGRVIQKIEII